MITEEMSLDDEIVKVTVIGIIENLMELSHKTAVDSGWWEGKQRTQAECIALVHSELSEALECLRTNGNFRKLYSETDGKGNQKPEGVASEYADVLIRIFDLCEHFKIPLGKALVQKMKYNKTRSYRHGGKKL